MKNSVAGRSNAQPSCAGLFINSHLGFDWPGTWIHVDMAAPSASGYFNYLNNGITNGWDWYEVDGGRQDFMNYFKLCRESTIELSNTKTPNPSRIILLLT